MQPIATFSGHTASLYALAAGERPGHFLSAGGDGRVVEWDLAHPENGEVRATVSRPVFALHVLRDERLLLLGTDTGGLHVIDLAAKRERHLFEVHGKGVFRFLELPDGRLLCAGGDGSLSVWAVSAGVDAALVLLRQIPLGDAKLRDLALDPSGRQLAVACGDGPIRILDTERFNETHTLEGHPEGAMSVAFHPTKPVLLSGGKDGHLRLWRMDQDYRAMHAWPAHSGTLYAIAFDPEGKRFVTTGRDKAAKLWDAATLDPLGRLDRTTGGHTHSVNAALWLGDVLLTVSDDRTVRAFR